MSCKKIQMGDLDDYVHGELSAADAEALDAHLSGCEACVAELRNLRRETQLFRWRADAEQQEVPAFADVLARIHRVERSVAANDVESNRGVVSANALRPGVLKAKAESARSGEGKHGFSRWAQVFVACAATAAAAGSLLMVTPPTTEPMTMTHTHGEEMEIGADPICTPENSSASAEVLVSVAPPRAGFTQAPSPSHDNVETCNTSHDEECATMDRICDEASLPVCGEGGP